MTEAEQLVGLLERKKLKLVLAESCTAGLVAAELAQIPGVSNHLCGSAVTYRSETKSAWLGIDPEIIQRHTAVSREVAGLMAQAVMMQTAEADVAAAITGHLGPSAPPDFDGIVFIALIYPRTSAPETSRHQLNSLSRTDRQAEAAGLVLQQLLHAIQ